MKRVAIWIAAAVFLAMAFPRTAEGCEIEGIINWEGRPVPHPDTQYFRIHEGGWDLAGSPISEHCAWGGDVFLPKDDHKMGTACDLKVLGGAGVAHYPGVVDCYVVYSWVDTNNNGIADEGDKVRDKDGKECEQNWRQFSGGAVPQEQIFNVFESQMHQLYPGLSYIFIIRVLGHKMNAPLTDPPLDSWNYRAGEFSIACPVIHLQRVKWDTTKRHTWDANLSPLKYWPRLSEDDEDGWKGVDPYELLWIRINQPPAAPGPHGPK